MTSNHNELSIKPPKQVKKKMPFVEYMKLNWMMFIFLIPAITLVFIFNYIPMSGIVLAFKDFDIFAGDNIFDSILVSPWVGFQQFHALFADHEVWNAFRNTLIISTYKIVFLFPLPIMLAVMINELRHLAFKKVVQTLLYLPHFLSWVVITALFMQVLGPYGVINNWLKELGFIDRSIAFFGNAKTFRPLLVISAGWKEIGWNAIVYLAAITGINPQLYEAAKMDGANKIQQIAYITIPSITATIAMLFILRLGAILDAGFDQVFNMYNSAVYSTGDIIGTFVYRKGLGEDLNFSFGTAVGLFNSVVALILIVSGNYISSKYFKKGIW